MTPKEKAEKLVWIYYHKIEHTISDEYAKVDWEIAKQCALIAIDEGLSWLKEVGGNESQSQGIKVKQEIEKL